MTLCCGRRALARAAGVATAAVLFAAPARGIGDSLDARIRVGLERGRAWVAGKQRPDGTFPSAYDGTPGSHALVLWTLLEAGLPPGDPVIRRTLEYVRVEGDPSVRPTPNGNYTAALTLAALQAWHVRRAVEARPGGAGGAAVDFVAEVRRQVSAEERERVRRLVRYLRWCAQGHRWTYSALRMPAVGLLENPALRPVAALDPGLTAPALTSPAGPAERFLGDNSNAQYGWLGLRAGSILGVSLEDGAFARSEVERWVRTRRRGRPVTVRLTREEGEGFDGLWSGPELVSPAAQGGWAYGDGDSLPTMTTGGVASLLYAWQEAEERGEMTEGLRAGAREAVLGGIAELLDASRERIEEG